MCLLIIAQLYQQSHQATILKCAFSTIDFWQIGKLYACVGTISGGAISDHQDNSCTKNHQPGKTNEDVRGIKITSSSTSFIPAGVGNVFRNVEAIASDNAGFSQITQKDIAQFPNLKMLHFSTQKISVLSSDLFASNPQIQHISFAHNPLSYIDPGTFKFLSNLESLSLTNATCIDQYSVKNRAGVEQVKTHLSNICTSIFALECL